MANDNLEIDAASVSFKRDIRMAQIDGGMQPVVPKDFYLLVTGDYFGSLVSIRLSDAQLSWLKEAILNG